MGIESGSAEAMSVVPVLTFWVSGMALSILSAWSRQIGQLHLSTGHGWFITGICTTIILMQAPKLLGGSAGTGELPELLLHLWESLPGLNVPSLLLGLLALCILLLSKKIMPKFPMAVVLMALGVLLSKYLPLQTWGIATLSAVEPVCQNGACRIFPQCLLWMP